VTDPTPSFADAILYCEERIFPALRDTTDYMRLREEIRAAFRSVGYRSFDGSIEAAVAAFWIWRSDYVVEFSYDDVEDAFEIQDGNFRARLSASSASDVLFGLDTNADIAALWKRIDKAHDREARDARDEARDHTRGCRCDVCVAWAE